MRSGLTVTILGALLLGLASTSWGAIAHHPFAIGANEGSVGHQTGVGAWILAQESAFYLHLTTAVRATKASTGAAWGLIGISLAYGVFHAAGPGHGKAVVASYMVSNEVALRRGLVIAFLAAILQGAVATGLIGIAALIFHATAQRITAAAEIMELASYVGIVALGLSLVWRKGRALIVAARPATSFVLANAASGAMFDAALPAPRLATSRFSVDDGAAPHVHGPSCGHVHMPDPAALSGTRFDWRAAATTIVTAGARPCSGAILVLVFALAQGVFWTGVAATFAMSVGTAVTTGALAAAAVFAKGFAIRLSGQAGDRAALVGRLVELGAALCVLAFGTALLVAALSGVHVGA